MNWNLTVPANGRSRTAAGFRNAAHVAVEAFLARAAAAEQTVSAETGKQIDAALKMAEKIIDSGIAGAEEFYVAISGHSTENFEAPEHPRTGNIVSLEVHQRPVREVTAEEEAAEVPTSAEAEPDEEPKQLAAPKPRVPRASKAASEEEAPEA